jgi:hypothetical protein
VITLHWVACKVLEWRCQAHEVVGYSLLELWERIEEDVGDLAMSLDDYVKAWCWKHIREMSDVECFTSTATAKVQFVKGTLFVSYCVLLTLSGTLDPKRKKAAPDLLSRSWQELVQMGSCFRLVGSESMRRVRVLLTKNLSYRRKL